MSTPFFTVLVPTYNRAYTLRRLYNSLLTQNRNDFILMIIDDGSEDGTDLLIEELKKEAKIEIEYYKKTNAGKHRALNFAMTKIRSEATIIVDSDDWLASGALAQLKQAWDKVPENEKKYFSGVAGLCAYEDGRIIGTDYKVDHHVDAHPSRYNVLNKITGDKISFHLTVVLKQYPFPEILGEKFISESVVWNKISVKYKQRLINEVVLYKEYLPDGLSADSINQRVKNAKGTMLVYQVELECASFTLFSKLKSTLNYNRFMFHSGSCKLMSFKGGRLLQVICFCPSYLFYVLDKIKIRRGA